MTVDSTEPQLSPMMQQWKSLKEQAKGALLLFRLGDFYEAFFEDAKILSETIDVVLTARQSIPMSGIPHHQLDIYLEKLIEKQFVVAIAEQTENGDQTKGLVKREITEIISPATHLNGKKTEANYYFASLYQINALYGIAFLELSTGEFFTLEVDHIKYLINEVAKRRPKEILIPLKFEKKHPEFLLEMKNICDFKITIPHESRFEPTLAQEALTTQFGSHLLTVSGLKSHPTAIIAAGALLKYLKTDLCRNLSHLNHLEFILPKTYLKIDSATLSHLDILHTSKDKISLESSIDFTVTAMGKRALQFYLTHPLLDVQEIKKRQDAVKVLIEKERYKKIQDALIHIRDIQRIAKRIELDILLPKEAFVLLIALKSCFQLEGYLIAENQLVHFSDLELPQELKEITSLLETSLMDPPPQKIGLGPLFKNGYQLILDDLYAFKEKSQTYLEEYQSKLKDQYQIKNLKVGFSRAFGYFIEVSRGQSNLVPSHFEKLQTLVNSERFVTNELKEYERKMITCESQILQIEEEEYQKLKDRLKKASKAITKVAKQIGHLDVIASFAKVADENHFKCPIVDDSSHFEIVQGKHPMLALERSQIPFIANDTHFSSKQKMMLITGPNMAGKSTYIKQNALLVLLSQMGSFVPAQKMHIGYLDHIFSRVGASDDLNKGLSTFMVEMIETSNILHHATSRSLIILDEIGRGTSTYDGIAIASAVAEFLVSKKELSPKTLFATHYFELTKLEKRFEEIKNYHVAIHEKGDEIIFLRKIVEGILDKSFGIHVAKLAGIPATVIQRAKNLLKELEEEKPKKSDRKEEQFTFFDQKPFSKAALLKDQLDQLDINTLSAKQALDYLYQLKEDLKEP